MEAPRNCNCEGEKLTQLSRLPCMCQLLSQNMGGALVSGIIFYFRKGPKGLVCALLPEAVARCLAFAIFE